MRLTAQTTLTAALVLIAGAVQAQEKHRFLGRLFHRGETTSRQTAMFTTPIPSTQAPTAAVGADPSAFGAMLNRIRAAAGLSPLVYDPDLSSWAAQNNAAQARRGLGHHIVPNCFQNCAWNMHDAWSAMQSWLTSAGHRENLLRPNATRFGIAYGPGPFWTFNAR